MNPTKNAITSYTDYVDTNIGTWSYKTWSTSPIVQLPHGMMEAEPVFTPGVGDKYLADKIYGFAAGPVILTPVSGEWSRDWQVNASEFDHELEHAGPHYYRALLEDHDMEAEMTVSHRAARLRFRALDQGSTSLLVKVDGDHQWSDSDGGLLEGWKEGDGFTTYFSICINQNCEASQAEGFIALTFPEGNKTIDVIVGISYICVEQARNNRLRELPSWDFDHVLERAREAWDEALGKIEVEGGTEDQRKSFYTSIYHTLQRMKNITEDGKYYCGFDKKIHDAKGRNYYTGDALWDTYRCARPLQSLIEPEVFEDMVHSYIRMYEHSGLLPKFPHLGGDHPIMLGHHAASVIADAQAKGFTRFDLENAYKGMRKDALEMSILPWRIVAATELDRFYEEKGYFPALPVRVDAKVDDPDEWRRSTHDIVMADMPNQIGWLPETGVDEWVPEVDPWHRRQSVSVTLERAYDDWCTAQIAKALGLEEDYAYFLERAANYRNLFNGKHGFMWPRTADGEWVEPFDPKLSGGFAGEGFFTEVNAWIYTFHVQHDMEGLIQLMGGREAFIAKLNALFVEQYTMDKPAFLGQFPDMSGLIGMYCHGNEPSFHIPYLYNYAGAPWRTQKRVRDIMNLMYNAGPNGLCGDDDIGSLSSWYTFSAMGFYPVCPGRAVYDIGSPIFDKVTLHVGGGRTFVITADGVSQQNKYIQSAELNGAAYNRPWLTHEDLVNGGELRFSMGPRPNKAWGSDPDQAPPSMTPIH